MSGPSGCTESRLTVRLLELTRATGYELVQENGQRRLTAPELTTESRERIKGCEIFLGRLPRDCYEDELMPVLQTVGRMLELRLMLDFSGSTRGYAFALYENSSVARRACRALDGLEIRPGHKIGVVKSVDNCRLFFGGVPKDKKKRDFVDELCKILDGIVDVFLYPNPHDKSQNRGFIFVEFKDHRSAAMARRKLIPGKVVLWNHEIAVDWADPEPGEPVDDEAMESVTALFVRNLSVETPHQKIKEIFQKSTGVPVLKLKKINHFAFVHYQSRELAQHVLSVMTLPGGVAKQRDWEICWAKPSVGSSNNIDRQHSIEEALAKGRSCDGAPTGPKKQATDKRSKKGRPKVSTDNLPCSQQMDFQGFLEAFVTENFGAICQFECSSTIEYGHVCKVTIVGDENQALLTFQGWNSVSKEKAIEETSRELYWRLQCAIQNNYACSNGSDDPFTASNSNWQQPSRIKASR